MYRTWLHFLVCENVFYDELRNTALAPSEVYDLKGSWVSRNAEAVVKGSTARCQLCNEKYVVGSKTSRCRESANGVHKPSSVYKDQDLTDKIYLPLPQLIKIKETLSEDTAFLARMGIMDYSLLLGIDTHTFHTGVPFDEPAAAHTPGSGTPPFFRADSGGLTAYVVRGPGTYYFGLIDILQGWTMKKKLERFAKTRLQGKDPDGISALEPDRYRVRFLNHIGQITSDSEFKEALALSSSRSMSGGMSPAPTAEPSPPPKEGTGADASADEHV